jgi:hypothetical protein
MAFQFHTYGPSCRIRPYKKELLGPETIPPLRSQFFHYSRQPIDEPLSTTPYTADTIIRPFSAYDNDKLEESWQKFLKNKAEEKLEKRNGNIERTGSEENLEQSTSKRQKVSEPEDLSDSDDDDNYSEFLTSPETTPKHDKPSRDLKELESRQRRLSKPPQFTLSGSMTEGMSRGRAKELVEGSTFTARPNTASSGTSTTAPERPARSTSRPQMPPRDSTLASLPKVETVVGLSRLHAAEFPDMKVSPIYWEQVSDVAPMMRGTWFYKATMEPVEAPIANLLEKGYQYMKPWIETYKDEIASCLAVGPEAEVRLVYNLVPEQDNNAEDPGESFTIDKSYKARGFLKKTPRFELLKQHRTFGVIYADSESAQILRPNQVPSVSRGRRPLRDIVKQKEVGTIVVRGFDHRVWDKKHPLKGVYPPSHYRKTALHPQSGTSGLTDRSMVCQACAAEEEDPNVTDLVLVVHGIGQKLSERMESFAFTHAITSLRRDVTELVLSEEIRPILRDSLGSIICLPVNWRAKLKDEPAKEAAEDQQDDFFTLNDVTVPHMVETRTFINDVFVDIPYYMSNKHQHILSAVVTEANRIYGRWKMNNPNFHGKGRVHIIGHSLGSVIAMDILSRQPTNLPDPFDVVTGKAKQLLDFDTKNVFFIGSPLGFFFHLHHTRLKPRRGRKREGSTSPVSSELGAEQGPFGCPAVDNVYNVIHPQDPVAYRINPCVDVKYAANLKPAFLPTFDLGWISGVFGRRSMPLIRPTTSRVDSSIRPSMRNFPSNVEMEVHDFTKEEKAENKMYMLNDNGQIDWFLPLPGSFGIPYLNILYAHSSYWTSKELVRFLVVEIGRASGRGEAIPIFKAKKKLER